MKYADAKKLHNGDEVTVKKTSRVLTAVQAYSPRPTNILQRKKRIN